MHAPRAIRKRRINRGPQLKGSARFTETGVGNGERINVQSFDSGVPQNATSFMTKHKGSSVRKNSAVTCQLGGSAAKLIDNSSCCKCPDLASRVARQHRSSPSNRFSC